MNKWKRRYLIGGLLVCCASAGLVDAAEVSLRADTWYPMNGEPGSDKPGFMIEIAQKALAAGGHTVNYQTMPWERAVKETRAGNFDCVIGAFRDDAPDFIFPETEQGKAGQSFYVKKGDAWRFTGNMSELDNVSVGVIGGYAYGDAFAKYLEAATAKSNVQTINGDNALEQNLKKVLAGRVTTTPESDYVAEAKIKEMGLDGQFEKAGELTPPAPMYIACSPAKSSSAEYARLLSDGVNNLRTSGELKVIMDKYGLTDWQ